MESTEVTYHSVDPPLFKPLRGCNQLENRNHVISPNDLLFPEDETYPFYNDVSYAFSKRNFSRFQVNARRFYEPRNLDRCVLFALPRCLAQYQSQRNCEDLGFTTADGATMADSKVRRQVRFLGLGRRDPFEAVSSFVQLHSPKVSCSNEEVVERKQSFPDHLETPEFNAALLDCLVGSYARERWDGLDVDGTFEKFLQKYEGREVQRRRKNYCYGLERYRRQNQDSRKTGSTTSELSSPTKMPTLPRLYRGKLSVCAPGRSSNWKVRYWDTRALDKVALPSKM